MEPARRSDPIDAARETAVDVAEESLGFLGSVAKVGSIVGAGALATAKTVYNLAMDAIDSIPTPSLNIKKDETQPVQKKEEKEEIKKEQVQKKEEPKREEIQKEETKKVEAPPMKAGQKVLLSRFAKSISDGTLSISWKS